jgi:hypothetical protein
MINIDAETTFLKKIRDLQEEFDKKILELKKEFYKPQEKIVNNKLSHVNLSVEKRIENVKIETLKKDVKSDAKIIFKIVDKEIYNNMKLEFNKNEDFMSYNHIVGYYLVEVQYRDYWFKKIVFDHFNKLQDFFDCNDLSFLNYKSILEGAGIKIIKSKPDRKEYKYKPISIEDLEDKLSYYHQTNNKKWFRRYWNHLSKVNPERTVLLKPKFEPLLSSLNMV